MVWNILKSRSFLSAYILVIVMLVGAVVLQQRDILFPEIAGMAMGVMVFQVPHWMKKPVHLWLSPTLGAFIGTSLNDLSLMPLPKILIWSCDYCHYNAYIIASILDQRFLLHCCRSF